MELAALWWEVRQFAHPGDVNQCHAKMTIRSALIRIGEDDDEKKTSDFWWMERDEGDDHCGQ